MADATASTRIGVIMAGGVGERFWPISRPDRPKQLLPLGPSDRTLLEDTVYRLGDLIPRDRLVICTSRTLREPILQAGLSVADDRVIAEPARRNTMGAVAWATAWAMGGQGLAPERTIFAIIPADQHVGDVETFRQNVRTALAAAERLDALVTIGIEPGRPETGYGYIEMGDEPIELPGQEPAAERLYPVIRFREKPDADTAVKFYRSGLFLWNGGMFFWRGSTFLAELDEAAPEIARVIREMAAAMADGDAGHAEELFAELPDTSVDYALMERSRNVVVVRAGFPWDDLGAWDAWRRVAPRDEEGNATYGDPLLIDCRDCAVYEDAVRAGMHVAVIGMDGVIVAATPDGVLVAPVDRAQQVRDVAQMLKNEDARTGGSDE